MKRKINRGKIKSVKTVVGEFEFDSKTEADYYVYLINNKEKLNIKEVILQPKYTLLEPFNVICNTCRGTRKQPSDKTGKPVNCKKCKGTGLVDRQTWTYTADFKVIYQDGHFEIIDVKGHANERFPQTKKLFEYMYRTELIVIKKAGKGWVRK